MNSQEIFSKACELMPGGVNSPVRAYRAVGMTPPFIERAEESHIFDVDGNKYVDYVGSWGPMILGHAREEVVRAVTTAAVRGTSFGAPTNGEVELAELIRSPFHGNDAYGQFRYRGGDECHPCCKRLYRQGLYCEI